MRIAPSRRTLIKLGGVIGASLLMTPLFADEAEDTNAIVNDPDAPTLGNRNGDLTIVEFFDYNCPYCKSAEPNLLRLVRMDGNIRLVYKDWPILGEASIKAAQWALAAEFQEKYHDVHAALMAIPGSKIATEKMRQAISDAGIDMNRLDADLRTHAEEIDAHLTRNRFQADMLELQGTPAYLVGRYKVTSALTFDGFKRVTADAREMKD